MSGKERRGRSGKCKVGKGWDKKEMGDKNGKLSTEGKGAGWLGWEMVPTGMKVCSERGREIRRMLLEISKLQHFWVVRNIWGTVSPVCVVSRWQWTKKSVWEFEGELKWLATESFGRPSCTEHKCSVKWSPNQSLVLWCTGHHIGSTDCSRWG